ncbi:hypothetical protein [Ligilactobacillus equi]|nr:hypothetical protein [Ligilactobacillus equi]
MGIKEKSMITNNWLQARGNIKENILLERLAKNVRGIKQSVDERKVEQLKKYTSQFKINLIVISLTRDLIFSNEDYSSLKNKTIQSSLKTNATQATNMFLAMISSLSNALAKNYLDLGHYIEDTMVAVMIVEVTMGIDPDETLIKGFAPIEKEMRGGSGA